MQVNNIKNVPLGLVQNAHLQMLLSAVCYGTLQHKIRLVGPTTQEFQLHVFPTYVHIWQQSALVH